MRKTVVSVSIVMGLIVAFAAPASATNIPRTGERIQIAPVLPPPATFPANTPFWIGDAFYGPKELVLEPGTYSQVFIDGNPVAMVPDITFYEVENVAFVAKWNLHNFRRGLPAGTHHLEQIWYLQGVFWFSAGGDTTFVSPRANISTNCMILRSRVSARLAVLIR